MKCQECGMEIEGTEYHPYAFCVLVKAGLNTLSVILEAVGQLKSTEQKTYVDTHD